MSKRPPSGNVDVRLGSGTQTSPEPLDPETPFRLLVLGDFGGAGVGPLATRKLHAVDRDVLEEELGRLQVTMNVPLGNGRSAKIDVRELDDFHPDRLLERVDALEDGARCANGSRTPGRSPRRRAKCARGPALRPGEARRPPRRPAARMTSWASFSRELPAGRNTPRMPRSRPS